MYQDFFGFSALPFELTPDPRFLYLPPGHQEALSTLQYGVLSGKGLTVLTGEAGLGKTTLLRAALEQLHGVATRVITISNPALTRPEFLEVIARSLETDVIGGSKPAVLNALESALYRDHDNGTRTVLIADEAHVMPDELLEEIRLLGNFETSSRKLLSIILVGQPELADRFNEPSLRQLKQRVALRCGLVPLTASQTEAYVTTRLKVVGRAAAAVFSTEAFERIHRISRGIPRVINVVCDNALLAAFAAGHHVVEAQLIDDVGRDFDLPVEAPIPKNVAVAEVRSRPPAAAPPEPVVASAAQPAPKLVASAAPQRLRPPAPRPPAHAPSRGTVAARDNSLFTIYTRRKGFFSRVFS
jgi:general secretion pathway protein A